MVSEEVDDDEAVEWLRLALANTPESADDEFEQAIELNLLSWVLWCSFLALVRAVDEADDGGEAEADDDVDDDEVDEADEDELPDCWSSSSILLQ